MADAKKGTDATERVAASTTIEGALEAVFAVLADPSAHADIDGTGRVRASLDGERIAAAGQVFHVAMWQPGTESPETGELSFGGWIWRYDLEATGPSRTTVTLTYDWSAVPPHIRECPLLSKSRRPDHAAIDDGRTARSSPSPARRSVLPMTPTADDCAIEVPGRPPSISNVSGFFGSPLRWRRTWIRPHPVSSPQRSSRRLEP
ncbi:MAG TPA: hypothetical protein VM282_09630 [Acidimicrobiales bacterium]|nr:hypothetical protein [Acidimicrobiales bacterium]